ncbi:MAG: cytochrome d ubiquinol oxidase subunit II, partial [Syntrophobacterales bacterium]
MPALIFGVAVGNVLQGVPFHFTEDLHSIYEGTFFGLLNPFALLAGVVSLTMLLTHGAAWLSLKAAGEVAERARAIGAVTGVV